mmetsp:Transcript_60576/g.198181  ORF Transcript_60576/g.198181 Transcript_60576/m.198181 type:complete len:241 (-) Transcript_60576:1044-1766(-)
MLAKSTAMQRTRPKSHFKVRVASRFSKSQNLKFASQLPVTATESAHFAHTAATQSLGPSSGSGFFAFKSQSRRFRASSPSEPAPMSAHKLSSWDQSTARHMIPPGCPSTLCKQVQSSMFHNLKLMSPPLAARLLFQQTAKAQTPVGCAPLTLLLDSPVAKSQSLREPSPQPPSASPILSPCAASTVQPPPMPSNVRLQVPLRRSQSLHPSVAPLSASISSQSATNARTAPEWPSKTSQHE